MRIPGGHTVEVYRVANRDRYGDGSPTLIGTISNVVFQWASADPLSRGQENEMMSTVIFCPRSASVKLQARDRIRFDGETYQVIGDRSWDERNPATGHDFGYYMMQVESIG